MERKRGELSFRNQSPVQRGSSAVRLGAFGPFGETLGRMRRGSGDSIAKSPGGSYREAEIKKGDDGREMATSQKRSRKRQKEGKEGQYKGKPMDGVIADRAGYRIKEQRIVKQKERQNISSGKIINYSWGCIVI